MTISDILSAYDDMSGHTRCEAEAGSVTYNDSSDSLSVGETQKVPSMNHGLLVLYVLYQSQNIYIWSRNEKNANVSA